MTTMSRTSVSCGKRTLVARTCTECYQLKDARNFAKTKRGYYATICTVCMVARNRRWLADRVDVVRDKASNHRKEWTESEMELMLEMFDQKVSGQQIAETLGRSLQAVYAKHSVIKE